MNELERVINIINWLIFEKIIKNRRDLAEKLGYTESSLSQILNKRVPLTDKFIKKLSVFNSRINEVWLRTGSGEMLLPQYVSRELQRLHELPEYQNVLREEARIGYLTETASVVPLLPVSFRAGGLGSFLLSSAANECEKLVVPVKGIDFAITVAGDSMAPEYPAGSYVFVKKVGRKMLIDWGRTYLLDTCGGVVLKNIMPGGGEDRVRCESVNPKYPPFEVRLEDISGIYRVVMCMTLK